ncbi:MAG: B12-binding domain-containing radical SAM protein, partial [Vulcanimicrobiaceae bacterium]
MTDTCTTDACNVLLVFPGFNANSFWNYQATCEIVGAKYPGAPLGLITVAAKLPRHWSIKLVNRNTEDLDEADLEWADMIMTGGMMPQQWDTLALIDLVHAHGKVVVVGGPGITSTPEPYHAADFKVLGEAEGLMDRFVADWRAGVRAGTYEGVRFKADVTAAPIPRWDLLKFDQYLHVGVQFSRGCPFTCEFCDIIELYGRVPRTKTVAQAIGELDSLYALGYRGHVDFVDDNLIGNKKAVKAFLPHLKAWQEKHQYPFEFSTEASVNLADDDELLGLMRDASFFAVFIGIESPDNETLIKMQKKQNARRVLSESIRRIYDAGIFVMGGFIVGFDTETDAVAGPIV